MTRRSGQRCLLCSLSMNGKVSTACVQVISTLAQTPVIMAGNSGEVTYVQFDSPPSSQSTLSSPTVFALRLILLTFFVVAVTIVTMSSLTSKEPAILDKLNGSNDRKLPKNLQIDLKYDQLPILSMSSAIEIEATFHYNSSTPYDALISLSDIDRQIPLCTWNVRNLSKEKSLGFFSTEDKIHVGNGTTWSSRFSWLRANANSNGTNGAHPSTLAKT